MVTQQPYLRGLGYRAPCGCLKPWMALNPAYTVLSYTYRPMMKFNLKLGSVRPCLRGEPHMVSRQRQAGKREVPAPSCETFEGTSGVQILRLLHPVVPWPVSRPLLFLYGGPTRGNMPVAVRWVYVQLCLLLLYRGRSPATPYTTALPISRKSPLTCTACLKQFMPQGSESVIFFHQGSQCNESTPMSS